MMNGKIIKQVGKYFLFLENRKKYDVTAIVVTIKNFDEDEYEVYDEDYIIKDNEVASLIINGKLYTMPKKYHAPNNDRNSKQTPKTSIQQTSKHQVYEPSTAPYNFVPLNDGVIEYEPDIKNVCGYIDIGIETLTPIFIRGEGTDFYKVAGVPVIPGSSLRGLIRTMVEIMSFGKFGEFDDKTLYHRANKSSATPLTGFLVRENGKYFVHPCSPNGIYDRSRDYRFSITHDKINTPFHYYFREDECTFSTGECNGLKIWHFYNKKPIKYLVTKETIAFYEMDEDRDKNAPHIFNALNTNRVDAKYKEKDRLVQNQSNEIGTLGVPVFFTLNSAKKVNHISHCKWGRMPYEKKISDHIQPHLLDANKKDFAEAIFGTTEYAGSVQFEDAFLQNFLENEEYYFDKNNYFVPQILSSPKPTAYQLYKEPDEHGNSVDWNGNHYSRKKNENDEKKHTLIRGNKMYWHRQTPDNPNNVFSWVKRKVEANEHQNSASVENEPIQPLKPGCHFIGRIRFNNLSEQELGALLTAIQLPEDCAHKLGMGKPLGLGSVKITVSKLTIIDRKKRYARIFDDNNNWNIGEETPTPDIKSFQSYFTDYVLVKLGKPGGFWELARMRELKILLTWNKEQNKTADWLKKTNYMEVGTFKRNKVLQKPNEVLTSNKSK